MAYIRDIAKRSFIWLFLFLTCLSTLGQTSIQFLLNSPQFQLSQAVNDLITVQPWSIGFSGQIILMPVQISGISDSTGQYTFTNLFGSPISGFYHYTIAVSNSSQRVNGNFWVQSTNLGTLPETIVDLVNGAPAFPPSTWAWSAQASDMRYAQGTNTFNLGNVTNVAVNYFQVGSNFTLQVGVNISNTIASIGSGNGNYQSNKVLFAADTYLTNGSTLHGNIGAATNIPAFQQGFTLTTNLAASSGQTNLPAYDSTGAERFWNLLQLPYDAINVASNLVAGMTNYVNGLNNNNVTNTQNSVTFGGLNLNPWLASAQLYGSSALVLSNSSGGILVYIRTNANGLGLFAITNLNLVVSNINSSASITAAGTISVVGNISGAQVSGSTLTSSGNLNVDGNGVFGGNGTFTGQFSAAGGAATIDSSGDITWDTSVGQLNGSGIQLNSGDFQGSLAGGTSLPISGVSTLTSSLNNLTNLTLLIGLNDTNNLNASNTIYQLQLSNTTNGIMALLKAATNGTAIANVLNTNRFLQANTSVNDGSLVTNLITAPASGGSNFVVELPNGQLTPFPLTSLPSGGGSGAANAYYTNNANAFPSVTAPNANVGFSNANLSTITAGFGNANNTTNWNTAIGIGNQYLLNAGNASDSNGIIIGVSNVITTISGIGWTAESLMDSILEGFNNTNEGGNFGTIINGSQNGLYSVPFELIGNGQNNGVHGTYSAIADGQNNHIGGNGSDIGMAYSFIGNGASNLVSLDLWRSINYGYDTVLNGLGNVITNSIYATVVNGQANFINSFGATTGSAILNGNSNSISLSAGGGGSVVSGSLITNGQFNVFAVNDNVAPLVTQTNDAAYFQFTHGVNVNSTNISTNTLTVGGNTFVNGNFGFSGTENAANGTNTATTSATAGPASQVAIGNGGNGTGVSITGGNGTNLNLGNGGSVNQTSAGISQGGNASTNINIGVGGSVTGTAAGYGGNGGTINIGLAGNGTGGAFTNGALGNVFVGNLTVEGLASLGSVAAQRLTFPPNNTFQYQGQTFGPYPDETLTISNAIALSATVASQWGNSLWDVFQFLPGTFKIGNGVIRFPPVGFTNGASLDIEGSGETATILFNTNAVPTVTLQVGYTTNWTSTVFYMHHVALTCITNTPGLALLSLGQGQVNSSGGGLGGLSHADISYNTFSFYRDWTNWAPVLTPDVGFQSSSGNEGLIAIALNNSFGDEVSIQHNHFDFVAGNLLANDHGDLEYNMFEGCGSLNGTNLSFGTGSPFSAGYINVFCNPTNTLNNFSINNSDEAWKIRGNSFVQNSVGAGAYLFITTFKHEYTIYDDDFEGMLGTIATTTNSRVNLIGYTSSTALGLYDITNQVNYTRPFQVDTNLIHSFLNSSIYYGDAGNNLSTPNAIYVQQDIIGQNLFTFSGTNLYPIITVSGSMTNGVNGMYVYSKAWSTVYGANTTVWVNASSPYCIVSNDQAVASGNVYVLEATNNIGAGNTAAENLQTTLTGTGWSPLNSPTAGTWQDNGNTPADFNVTSTYFVGTGTPSTLISSSGPIIPYSSLGAGTVVNTNWVLGGKYSFGFPVMVNAKACLTASAVSGSCDLDLEVTGNTTNTSAIQTTALSVAGNYTNVISAFIPANATFDFTNRSSGSGDSASVSGGQYIIQ